MPDDFACSPPLRSNRTSPAKSQRMIHCLSSRLKLWACYMHPANDLAKEGTMRVGFLRPLIACAALAALPLVMTTDLGAQAPAPPANPMPIMPPQLPPA